MSSLSTVVSGLVRASMGTSVPSGVPDDDLDRIVADLILREAKEKAERYDRDGIRAFLRDSAPDSSGAAAPRANKRFLSSIIRNTDDHNRAVLRAQVDAARENRSARGLDDGGKRRRTGRWRVDDDVRRDFPYRRGAMRGFSDDECDDEDEEQRSREEAGRVKRRRRSGSRVASDSGGRSGSDGEADRRRGARRRREGGRGRGRSESLGERDDGCLDSDAHERRQRRRKRVERQEEEADRRSGTRARRRTSRSPSPVGMSAAVGDTALRIKRRLGSSSQGSSPSTPTGGGGSHRKRSRSPKEKRSHRETDGRHHRPEGRTQLSSTRAAARTPLIEERTKSSNASNSYHHHRRRRPHEAPAVTSSNSPSVESHSRSPSPTFSVPASKMDKYFDKSYDPRLDVAALAKPVVPATGLIDEAQYEGWDAMLELIRLRRLDKHEKERMAWSSSKKGSHDRWTTSSTPSLMEIEYKKKGAIREWDLGKEAF